MRPVVVMVGTRPEGIKLIPVYWALQQAQIPVLLCATFQHKKLLTNILDLFDVVPDYAFTTMRYNQDLTYITQMVLKKTDFYFKQIQPALVVVQGDTTSSMASALSAFYLKIPIAHVEAGLRTYNKNNPFPEEVNRKTISLLADYHFAPTATAVHVLYEEKICPNTVFCTGNPGIDALYFIRERIAHNTMYISKRFKKIISEIQKRAYKLVVVTLHRRELSQENFIDLIHVLKTCVEQHRDSVIIYVYHPRPAVIEGLKRARITHHERFMIIPPVAYHEFIYLLMHAALVVTDSGGVQEEAVTLGCPVLVVRATTERIEGVQHNYATLIGTTADALRIEFNTIFSQLATKQPVELYGDGKAGQKIARIIQEIIY